MRRNSYPNFRRAQRGGRRRDARLTIVTVLGGAAIAGAAIGAGLAAPDAVYRKIFPACRAVDGDTLRCGNERVRLLGIDAPELPGHCAPHRVCAPGDPVASRRTLEQALSGDLSFTRVGLDRYRRTLALVAGSQGDLSCWQLAHGAAIYKPSWDNGGRVATLCGRFAR